MNKNTVKPLYMEPYAPLKHRARVTKIGVSEIGKKTYRWIQLNETIFHPKGGGQPSDEGTLGGIKVTHIHKLPLDKNRLDLFEILHCFEEHQLLPFKEGDEVELIVDPVKRELHSRMHTGGHLLAEVVRIIFPELEPYHGNHDPNDGYVKFKILKEFTHGKAEIFLKVQPELDSWVKKDLPISVVQLSSGMRAIKFCHHIMSCGGTHVNHLHEIGKIEIKDVSINKKENVVTIKYGLNP